MRYERTNERTNDWLPADLRRDLAAIAAAEGMTVRALMLVAARELVAAYHALPRPTHSLETVWRPHRDAPSLLGERLSKAS